MSHPQHDTYVHIESCLQNNAHRSSIGKHMKKYLILEKKVGETPLAALEALRNTDTSLVGVPLAYAGRLDPMASGKVLILIGDECKNQKRYHSLDKEYEFEVLFGFSTDTGDILGIAEEDAVTMSFTRKSIQKAARSLLGTHILPYPQYSSKTVHGKPLFLWTLEGRLDEITVPTIAATVYNIQLIGVQTVPTRSSIEHILKKIELIPKVTQESKALGRDFRRDDIRTRWNELKNGLKHEQVTIAKFRITVSSGTYIRSLAPILASKLGTIGLAYSIHRTKIGYFRNFLPFLGFWSRSY